MVYTAIYQIPSVDTYCELRSLAGLSAKSRSASAIGLPNSLFAVQIMFQPEIDEKSSNTHDPVPVGMGRVIGDGALFFQVVDIARTCLNWKIRYRNSGEMSDSPVNCPAAEFGSPAAGLRLAARWSLRQYSAPYMAAGVIFFHLGETEEFSELFLVTVINDSERCFKLSSR